MTQGMRIVHEYKRPQKLSCQLADHNNPAWTQFDAVVVGGGPAGATAAYFMARAGLRVVLLERATPTGGKNCGGTGIIASHTEKLFPGFWREAPWERVITQQAFLLLTDDSLLNLSFNSLRLATAPFNRFSFLRVNFDRWLQGKAQTAGTHMQYGCCATEIIKNGDRCVGVITSPHNTAYYGNVLILAEGANALLAERAGLIPPIAPQNLSLYVKETLALTPGEIERRFNLRGNAGAVLALYGHPTAGFNGTASIYTNWDSLSINVGTSLNNFITAAFSPYDLLQRLKSHPLLQPLLADGKTVEYCARIIPEGGYHAIPPLVHHGLLIVGDAASLANGTHGINLAMWSGFYAAQAAIAAQKAGDYSPATLSLYKKLLDESFIIQDLKANAGAARLMRERPYLFDLYTRMANEAAYYISRVYLMPKRAKRKFIWKKVSSMQSLKKMCADLWHVMKVIR